MNNRDKLLEDGYLIFPGVVPEELRSNAETLINLTTPEPCFIWKDPVSLAFREWGQAFLNSKELNFQGWEADIHIFNRRPGTDALFWHDDDGRHAPPAFQPSPVGAGRRVFCCTYFSDTYNGRSPLRVIPGSHNGGYEEFRARFAKMRLQMSLVHPYENFKFEDKEKDFYTMYPDLFGPHADEVVLESPGGTMVVCDERIMHGASLNYHTKRRPMALWWLQKCQEDRLREKPYVNTNPVGIPF